VCDGAPWPFPISVLVRLDCAETRLCPWGHVTKFRSPKNDALRAAIPLSGLWVRTPGAQ